MQEAWGHGDLGRLRQVMTPEMLSYFSEELTRNTSEGVQNLVSDVRLLKGDITESWDEGDLEYATAHMQWSANDYVVRLGRSPGAPDYIVSGDPTRPTEAEEVWTFVRQPERQLAAVGDSAGVSVQTLIKGPPLHERRSPFVPARARPARSTRVIDICLGHAAVARPSSGPFGLSAASSPQSSPSAKS